MKLKKMKFKVSVFEDPYELVDFVNGHEKEIMVKGVEQSQDGIWHLFYYVE